ncbi:hypothetical protein ABEB36_014312 [Hypothenemus hampei]|uniref:Uncharacterized protein n=1 Tax=Hypothenemus hampei TaxID=57062 RepID=A0ABD1E3Z8_HYPHA
MSPLHRDMEMDTVRQTIHNFARRHEQRLLDHTNVEAIQLLDNANQTEIQNNNEDIAQFREDPIVARFAKNEAYEETEGLLYAPGIDD